MTRDLHQDAPVRISVVVPLWNEEAYIVRCLEALLAQTVPPFEILLVDNMSTDRTVERALSVPAGSVPVRVLRQQDRQGLVPTRDAGFAAAGGDVVARIDGDTIVDGDWIEQLTACFASGRVAAATGPVGYYDVVCGSVLNRVDGWGRRLVFALGRRQPFLFGANMALRRSAWERIAGEVCADIDDRFHEDIDLAIHLTRCDLVIEFAPAVTASISARRLNSTAAAFDDYLLRFDRTFAAHGVTHAPIRSAASVLRAAFPLLRLAHLRAAEPRFVPSHRPEAPPAHP